MGDFLEVFSGRIIRYSPVSAAIVKKTPKINKNIAMMSTRFVLSRNLH